MNNAPFRSKFNWEASEGDVTRLVSYNIQANETSDPIPQEKLLNPEACVVLETDQKNEFCEQTISVNPLYQVTKLALIAECRRIESFVGKTSEYYQTHNGELVVFAAGSELYRFDVQFEVCGTADFILRYITPGGSPLCLYGVHLVLEKNSNPLGMFASDSTLNRAMIELRVKDSKLSDKAARCKQFVLDSMGHNGFLSTQKLFQSVMNNNMANTAAGTSADPSLGGSSQPSQSSTGDDPGGAAPPENSAVPSISELLAKQYMDAKFAALEAKIDAKLEALESRQNQKLDEIVSLLRGISSK